MKRVLAAVLLDAAFVGGILAAVPLLFGKHQMPRRLDAMQKGREARAPARSAEQPSVAPATPTASVPPPPPPPKEVSLVEPKIIESAPLASDVSEVVPEGVPGGVVGGIPENVSPRSLPAPDTTEILAIPWAVMAKKLIHRVEPVYPREAKAAGLGATVIFKAVIADDGTVRELRTDGHVRPDFEQAARDAVMQWKFQPTVVGARPVPVMTTISIIFTVE